MSTALEQIQKRDGQRLTLLRTLFDETNKSGNFYIGLEPTKLGMTEPEFTSAARYLDGEGLVEAQYMDGPPALRISHSGIKEIEAMLRFPERETEHFTPVTINIVNSTVGAVQIAGEGNTATTRQR
jgi:hypothetical protein